MILLFIYYTPFQLKSDKVFKWNITIVSIMEQYDESSQFGGFQKTIESNDDLNSIFRTLTGFYYNEKKKKFLPDKNVKIKYCPYITSRLFDYAMKSLSGFTKLTKNSSELVAFKSALSYAGLTKIFNDFSHECKLKVKGQLYFNCLRSKEAQDFEITIEGLWKVIDDSYRQGLGGFIPELLYKNWNINEQIQSNKPTTERKSLRLWDKKIPVSERQVEGDDE